MGRKRCPGWTSLRAVNQITTPADLPRDTLVWPQEDELEVRAAKINQLGRQVASEGRQRAEERRGRTEAERRLRAEKQVSTATFQSVPPML